MAQRGRFGLLSDVTIGQNPPVIGFMWSRMGKKIFYEKIFFDDEKYLNEHFSFYNSYSF